jgi:ABC-type proline/glycine betaine transport system substrate-binding protein
MRKILITAVAAAALSAGAPASAGAMEPAPNVAPGTPALQTLAGRASLCRAHLEAQGYPYTYLHRRAGWGVVRTCAARLYRRHHDHLRRV